VWGFGNCEKGEKLEMYLIRWSFSGGGGGGYKLLGYRYWYVSVPGGFVLLGFGWM